MTVRKVRMCTGRDSCCYSRDGRYFGTGTTNYDVECIACGRAKTIGTHHWGQQASGAAERKLVREYFGDSDYACEVCK